MVPRASESDDLLQLPLLRLKAQCEAANVPKTGSKEKLVERLLDPSAHQKGAPGKKAAGASALAKTIEKPKKATEMQVAKMRAAGELVGDRGAFFDSAYRCDNCTLEFDEDGFDWKTGYCFSCQDDIDDAI
uniref:SAP domain-containing protein n=1 Tax=Prymnesium polylepis TaxID=72548 RepID=A0A7S4M325_9EUKA|mmetsp:Transcript_16460/g.41685  ORF Transcript_16460/g.41685 Transcript_16460/m.41685 type:complete len:131 (+) Transcript_16460:627-1019(+)